MNAKNLLQPLRAVHQWYFRRKSEKRYERSITASLKHIVSRGGYAVQHGPFRGTKYLRTATGSALTPKLIGCYEEELHGVMDRIGGKDYKAIIDVGCAEGYYAVGLARLFERATVYAFDVDSRSQALCHNMALLNDVQGRMFIGGWCDEAVLADVTKRRKSLIVCDCEGYELQLLHPDRVDLRHCDILVELHDHVNPRITPEMIRRFVDTHDIEIIKSRRRDPEAYPILDGLPLHEKEAAVSEWRTPGQRWAFMTAKKEQ